MAGMIKWLVSSGVKPGSVKGSVYTTLIPITKENAGKRRHLLESQRPQEVVDADLEPQRPCHGDGRAPRRHLRHLAHIPDQPMQRRPSSFAIPLLAGPSARRNPVQALDRNGHPGDRPPDRRARCSAGHSRLPVARQPCRHRPAGGGDRLRRARHGAGHHRRRHRPFGRLDVRAERFLRAVLPQRAATWPVPAVSSPPSPCGALLGAVNGLLIGYLRLRAFITTLITLIIYRSAYDLLLVDYSNKIAAAFPDIPSWNFIGGGSVLGIPSVALVYIVVAIFGHVFLTRLRPGWHITAIGGSRRSAYNSGIPVRRTIALLLCRKRRADRDRRAVFRRPARHGRRRRRRRPRSHRADRHRARRHQPRRRQGLGRQGAGRHADRAADHQRPDHAVGAAAASTAWCWPASCWSPRRSTSAG